MWVCMVQVPLMAEVPRARAALDAHMGVAAVVQAGLGLFANLAIAEANKVRPRVCVCRGVWVVRYVFAARVAGVVAGLL